MALIKSCLASSADEFKPFAFIGTNNAKYLTSDTAETVVGTTNNGPSFVFNKKATAISVTIDTPAATFSVIRDNNGTIQGETISASGSIANPDNVLAITSGYSVSLTVTATF